ncbi:Flp family type IVb pilin [bacterium]|nr:MAG: Flp family type IVb pilin [bacterium]
MLKQFAGVLRDDQGQGLVEYALILALIAVVAIAVLKLIGTNATNKLNQAATNLQ